MRPDKKVTRRLMAVAVAVGTVVAMLIVGSQSAMADIFWGMPGF